MKSNIVRILVAAAAFCGALLALHCALRGLDWPTFRTQLHRLDWRWLALAAVFDVASYAAQGLRWRLLLAGSKLWQTTRAIYAGLFVNELIPLRPGEAVRAWMAARDLNVGLWTIVPTMLSERLMDGFWLALAFMGALAVAPLPAVAAHAVWIVAAAVAVGLVAALALGGKVRAGLLHPGALLMSAIFLIAQGLAFWSVLRASQIPLGLLAAGVVMIVVRLGTMIPGAPANLGTHQFATVMGLSLFGVPQAQAAAFSLVVFTVLTLPLMILGLCACLSAGVTWRRVSELAV
jgi:uncharacterized membrane protein YbhN (UPF0104 family)